MFTNLTFFLLCLKAKFEGKNLIFLTIIHWNLALSTQHQAWSPVSLGTTKLTLLLIPLHISFYCCVGDLPSHKISLYPGLLFTHIIMFALISVFAIHVCFFFYFSFSIISLARSFQSSSLQLFHIWYWSFTMDLKQTCVRFQGKYLSVHFLELK